MDENRDMGLLLVSFNDHRRGLFGSRTDEELAEQAEVSVNAAQLTLSPQYWYLLILIAKRSGMRLVFGRNPPEEFHR